MGKGPVPRQHLPKNIFAVEQFACGDCYMVSSVVSAANWVRANQPGMVRQHLGEECFQAGGGPSRRNAFSRKGPFPLRVVYAVAEGKQVLGCRLRGRCFRKDAFR